MHENWWFFSTYAYVLKALIVRQVWRISTALLLELDPFKHKFRGPGLLKKKIMYLKHGFLFTYY